MVALGATLGGFNRREMSVGQKLWQINWGLVLLVSALAGIGFAMLYSAAGGNFEPWAMRQMVRFGFGLVAMIVKCDASNEMPSNANPIFVFRATHSAS